LGEVSIVSMIFVSVYALIVSEKVHRTAAALVGAVVMLLLTFINQEEAINAIDWNTLGLLIGMMVIVEITKKTGLFEYLAIKAAKFSRGEPMRIILSLSLFTAIASAFLDNVTTVLLVVPVTFSITKALKVNPFAFLMAEIFASNIGGAATLIGDPPNIMIGGATDFSFIDFIVNLGPVVLIVQVVISFLFYLLFKKEILVCSQNKQKIMEFDEKKEIKDPVLLKKSIIILTLTIAGFIFHGWLHFQPATIAVSGAAFLLLLSGLKPEKVLSQLEWPVIFFFVGLFILVGTLEKSGVIHLVAVECLKITNGDIILTAILILWLSAIASAFIDNIPFVATMIPIITTMGEIGEMDVIPLWWALSMGACMGGNGTIVGASANVIVVGLAEQRGYPITFKKYFKTGFGLMLVSIIICSIYLIFMYLV